MREGERFSSSTNLLCKFSAKREENETRREREDVMRDALGSSSFHLLFSSPILFSFTLLFILVRSFLSHCFSHPQLFLKPNKDFLFFMYPESRCLLVSLSLRFSRHLLSPFLSHSPFLDYLVPTTNPGKRKVKWNHGVIMMRGERIE